MYRKSTLVLLLAAAILTACKDKKEADCVAPTIEKNLVGTWQATFTSKAGNSGPSTVTFKENGTMTGIGSLFKNTSAPTYSWKDDSWEKDQIGIAFTLIILCDARFGMFVSLLFFLVAPWIQRRIVEGEEDAPAPAEH